MSQRTLLSLAILVLAIVVVAFRDHLFVNLNYQLDYLEHHRAFSYAHSRFQALVAGMDASTLRVIKWGTAPVFIGINLALAIWLARVRMGDHRYRRALLIAFAVVTALALAAHGASLLWRPARPVSVMLLHAVQYPVVLLFVWLASIHAER